MIPVKKLSLYATLLMATLAFSPFKAGAADQAADPLQMLKIFPADIRAATAEVLQYPDTLIDLEKYRQTAKTEFNELLAPYPSKTQEAVRQLVPYRKLWRALGAYAGSQEDTKQLLKSYPKEVQSNASYLIKNNPDILGKVISLEKRTYEQYFQMISGLNPQAQAAFKKVGQQSGILRILSNALHLDSEAKPASTELKQKSQTLANQLLALNKEGHRKPPPSSTHSSEASAVLDASAKKFSDRLDSQIDQDPYSDDSIQATVTFSPAPYYNVGVGNRYYPYWY